MCPFCNSTRTKEVFATPKWSIISCMDCTIAWTLPAPHNIDYKEKNFHSKTKAISIDDIHFLWKKSILMQVDLLKKHLRPNSTILEIGCGQGLLLKEFKNLGFKVMGIEPSGTASDEARKSGLDVVTGYFPNPSLLNRKFDAVIMSHTLEHILNTDAVVEEIKEIIPEGGILMLIQTNWMGLMPRIYKSRWYAWVPEDHYWHFTPKGLSMYLKKFNFNIVDLEYSSLVHPRRLLWRIANLKPEWKDQFHLLAKISHE